MYPHERSLVKEFENRPFALIGVNSDKDLDRLRIRIVEEEISWRSFWNGPMGSRGPISTAWAVRGWPTVVIIDHRGVIRHRSHGGEEMERVLRGCIEEAEAERKQ